MSAAKVSSWLPELLGPHEIEIDGDRQAARSKWNFTGATVDDDGETLTIDFPGGGGAGSNNGRRKATIATGTATVGAGKAVCLSGVGDDATVRLANPTGLLFAGGIPGGIAYTGGTADSEIDVIVAGPVPKSILALDPGVACAVTLDSAGVPVRVTDATGSIRFYIGYCDTEGNLFVAPRRVTVFDVCDFGAVGDSTNGIDGTDDTAAFQAAMDAAEVLSGTVFIPPGGYRLTSTVLVPHRITIHGSGSLSVCYIDHYGDGFRHEGVIDGSTFGGLTVRNLKVQGIPTYHAYSITGATNASPIEITTSAPHGLNTDDFVRITGVSGNTAANRCWKIVKTAANKFTLVGSTGNGSFSGTGSVWQMARAAFVNLACSYDTFYDCDFIYSMFGFIADQTEICNWYNCRFQANDYAQFWVPSYGEYNPLCSAGFANVNSLKGCDFNGGLNGVAADAFNICTITDCNFNGQSSAQFTGNGDNTLGCGLRLAGCQLLGCTSSDFETTEGFILTYQSLITGQGLGGCSVAFEHVSMSTYTQVGTFISCTASFKNYLFANSVAASHLVGGPNAYLLIFEQELSTSKALLDGLSSTGRFRAAGNDLAKVFRSTAKPDGGIVYCYPYNLTTTPYTSWFVGDTAFSEDPAASGCLGWICTKAGNSTAAVFVPFGRTSGSLSKSVAGNVDVTLTNYEGSSRVLEFTGALTGNIAVKLPVAYEGLDFTIINNTTGDYSLTFKVTGQTGFVIPQGFTVEAYGTATDVAQCGAAYSSAAPRLSLSVAGSSDVNLTAVQGANDVFEFTGALTGNISVKWPTARDGRRITIYNNTTGAYTLTAKVTGQTGFVVPRGTRLQGYFDATDLAQSGFVDGVVTASTCQASAEWADTTSTSPTETAPKTSGYSKRVTLQTTTNAANQVIFTTPALPNNAITTVDAIIEGKKNGAADAYVIKLSGAFYRDAGGNCVRVGTDDNNAKVSGGLGVTADLNINGTTIEGRISPGGTVTLDNGAFYQLSKVTS